MFSKADRKECDFCTIQQIIVMSFIKISKSINFYNSFQITKQCCINVLMNVSILCHKIHSIIFWPISLVVLKDKLIYPKFKIK